MLVFWASMLAKWTRLSTEDTLAAIADSSEEGIDDSDYENDDFEPER